MPRRFDTSKFGLDHLKATAEKCKNWGRWGADDEIGTLNFITPGSIADAARLIRRGKVFSLGLNFDRHGPQRGLWGNRSATVPRIAFTNSSSALRLCLSPVRWARRSTRRRSSEVRRTLLIER